MVRPAGRVRLFGTYRSWSAWLADSRNALPRRTSLGQPVSYTVTPATRCRVVPVAGKPYLRGGALGWCTVTATARATETARAFPRVVPGTGRSSLIGGPAGVPEIRDATMAAESGVAMRTLAAAAVAGLTTALLTAPESAVRCPPRPRIHGPRPHHGRTTRVRPRHRHDPLGPRAPCAATPPTTVWPSGWGAVPLRSGHHDRRRAAAGRTHAPRNL